MVKAVLDILWESARENMTQIFVVLSYFFILTSSLLFFWPYFPLLSYTDCPLEPFGDWCHSSTKYSKKLLTEVFIRGGTFHGFDLEYTHRWKLRWDLFISTGHLLCKMLV